MKMILKKSAIVSFLFCLLGGLYLMIFVEPAYANIGIGIGLYFIGKGVFVGASLMYYSSKIE